MKDSFLSENFLLETESARTLYHEFAKDMPIFDYHCHLPPEDIEDDRNFENLTQIWLYGDHYKWRAMRSNGIQEYNITGKASDDTKFQAWAETVPYTMRNPLYHWTHLELKRYFGIDGQLLDPSSASEIYSKASALLQSPDYSVRQLLKKMKVKVVCTTDDPTDNLSSHKKLCGEEMYTKVLPTFRPDKCMAVDCAKSYNEYLNLLSECSDIEIVNYSDLLDAVSKRHQYFHEQGCRLSDHGIETAYAEDYTQTEVNEIFNKVRSGNDLEKVEALKIKSALMVEFAKLDFAKGWTQQLHLGAMRNNNSFYLKKLGPDTGFDSIDDQAMARPLSKFLDHLADLEQLPKTILYNLNPKDNEMLATMIGNFQDGSTPGKIQFGSGWWFLDQKDGMEKQMNALSNMGLLSRFVGMLTDSRSFLSYPRHEYFRRILCNLFGNDIENGLLPNEMEWIGKLVQNICFNNAKEYFGISID